MSIHKIMWQFDCCRQLIWAARKFVTFELENEFYRCVQCICVFLLISFCILLFSIELCPESGATKSFYNCVRICKWQCVWTEIIEWNNRITMINHFRLSDLLIYFWSFQYIGKMNERNPKKKENQPKTMNIHWIKMKLIRKNGLWVDVSFLLYVAYSITMHPQIQSKDENRWKSTWMCNLLKDDWNESHLYDERNPFELKLIIEMKQKNKQRNPYKIKNVCNNNMKMLFFFFKKKKKKEDPT